MIFSPTYNFTRLKLTPVFFTDKVKEADILYFIYYKLITLISLINLIKLW